MSVYPYQKSESSSDEINLEYDLDFEKKRTQFGFLEMKEELAERWERDYANAPVFPLTINSANQEMAKWLLSFEHTIFLNELAKKYSLSADQRDALPRAIWQVCLIGYQ